MKKLLAAVMAICIVLLLIVHRKTETVYRTEGNIIYFESGNYAVTTDAHGRTSNNPLELRYYAKYTYNNILLERGQIDYDGTFIPDNDPVENGRFFFFTILFISATWYLVFFAKADLVHIRDWYTSRGDVAITAMDAARRNALLKGNMRCDTCNDAPDFTVTKEERTQGMVFVEGNCNLCNQSKKIRLR